MIYLDEQATTPIDPVVADAMAPWAADRFANPHGGHAPARAERAAIEAARAQVAAVLACPSAALTFTGGATEAINTAIKGVLLRAPPERRRVVTVATEHSATLETVHWCGRIGFATTILPVRGDGVLDPAVLAAALGPDVALVSVMLVNNEIGVIQDIAAISAAAHAAGALMHCDAVQGFGRLPCAVDALGVDLLSVSGHKIYGPKGIGALYVRPGIALEPLLHGGGQEAVRSGTLPTGLCVGLGAAAARMAERRDADRAHVEALWARAVARLPAAAQINGSLDQRWHGNLNVSLPGLDSAALVSRLRDVAVSAGSACATSERRPSHVLAALGLGREAVRGAVRIGWGRFTAASDLDAGLDRVVAGWRE